MKSEITAEAVLNRAAEIVAKPENWHQGSFHNRAGTAFCVIGAIHLAFAELAGRLGEIDAKSAAAGICDFIHGPEQVSHEARGLFRRALRQEYGVCNIPSWNDAPSRQHHEVVAVFEKARALAAEKGL